MGRPLPSLDSHARALDAQALFPYAFYTARETLPDRAFAATAPAQRQIGVEIGRVAAANPSRRVPKTPLVRTFLVVDRKGARSEGIP